jgi:hypothetical protein
MQAPSGFLTSRPPALQTLFARYMNGQIADSSWRQFMHAYDDGGTTIQEKEALAEFYSDALQELGPDTVSLPALKEVEDLLAEIRV